MLHLESINEFYDRIIHSPIGEKLNGKCYECGSKKYIKWDYKVKKCPRCEDGIIDESDEGVLIMSFIETFMEDLAA